VDLKDIDITTPLRPDEIMPRMEHRVAPPAPAPAPSPGKAGLPLQPANKQSESKPGSGRSSPATDKAVAKAKAKERRERKEKGKRKEKKGSKSRSKSKNGDEALLIDLDDFGPADGGRTHVRHDSLETRQLKESAMDLLNFSDPIFGVTPAPAPGPSTVSGASSGGAGSGGLIDLDMLGAGSPNKPTVKDKEKDKDRGRSSKKGKGHSSSRRHQNGGPGPSGENAGGEDAGAMKALKFVLVKGKALKVEYSIEVHHGSHQAVIHFRCKNISSGTLLSPPTREKVVQGIKVGVCDVVTGELSDVSLTLHDIPSRLTLLPTAGSLATVGTSKDTFLLGASVPAGSTLKGSVVFTVPDNVDRSFAVPARVRYSTGVRVGGLNTDIGARRLSGSSPVQNFLDGTSQVTGRLQLYSAAFLMPGMVSPSAFAGLLSNRELLWQEGSIK
jgi:hypothetical protein